MNRLAIILVVTLAGCVAQDRAAPAAPATLLDVGGSVYSVRLEPDLPTWGMVVAADGSEAARALERRAPTVVVSGAPDRQTAIQAMIKFCASRAAVVSGDWDTDYIHFDRSRGEWLFPDVCT